MAALLDRLKTIARRIFRREPPHDPYSYVMANRRPRPGGRSAAAVVDEPAD
ncbi:MAG TPA: hypothetical protein VHC90_10030 [Bryobacteraceae bacterium]|nr:hypothetical protein [Bryobacteraceae bacterium]